MAKQPSHQVRSIEGPARKIKLNLLHMFVVVAEQQSLSRAAEVLGRGQPAVSAALKKLEERLDRKLATRGPTNFALTPAGRGPLSRGPRDRQRHRSHLAADRRSQRRTYRHRASRHGQPHDQPLLSGPSLSSIAGIRKRRS